MEVDILPNHLLKIIEKGECITVEFKKAKKNLPSSLFETVCAMLNRNGEHIFLGLEDDGTAIGVYKDYIKQLKKNFVNQCNNSEKLFPTAHLDIK